MASHANAQIIRDALDKATIGWNAPDGEGQENVTTVGFELDTDHRWMTFIFTADDSATLHIYTTFFFDVAQYDLLRVLETLNLINYGRLIDTHLELNPVVNKVRFRTSYVSSAPLVNPVEFLPRFNEHSYSSSMFVELIPAILASSEPVDDAVRHAYESRSAKLAEQLEN